MENGSQPLLSSSRDEDQIQDHPAHLAPPKGRNASFSSFIAGEGDIEPITRVGDFFKQFWVESKKLWYLAGPAIFTSLCQYSLGAITQVFAGHVGTIELAAVSVENSVIAGFSFVGDGECSGDAMRASVRSRAAGYAGHLHATIMGDSEYYSRGLELPLHIRSETVEADRPNRRDIKVGRDLCDMDDPAVVRLLDELPNRQVLAISEQDHGDGRDSLCGPNPPHRLQLALDAEARMGACGCCHRTKLVLNLWGFVRLSLASAVMLCLEVWYFMALILFAGYLKNAEIAVDGLSICMNILGWAVMVALGCNAAISVRVSNELGAGHPKTAKFAVVVVVITSFMIGLVIFAVLLISRSEYPKAFTSSTEVRQLVYELTPLLATSILINNVQPVLSGVAIGAGWQALIAYINIGCYYVFGIPLGLILGYKVDLGVQGIWYGMLSGTVVQTCILFFIIYKTNWNKEASIAGDRIKKWGGDTDEKGKDVENKPRVDE
ncbi:hypothetical protein HHK36_025014 [Tetracentron sinense]|uniref:Protein DETOXIFICATION n=1 Tax=Tetracentron sinense TaxID=13715 RepID=A0A834YQ42_TETSI|nr:hypothetical protein HHK36_025014 [Tetracentron sinense]